MTSMGTKEMESLLQNLNPQSSKIESFTTQMEYKVEENVGRLNQMIYSPMKSLVF